jgi:hypothetical protein
MYWTSRLYNILESVQYGIIYMFAAFFGGVGLDFVFQPYTEDISTEELIRQTLFQCILLILVVYFTRYWVKKIPILYPIIANASYKPYRTPEYNGEMMMGFVFLGSQLNLIQKIDLLSKRLYGWYYSDASRLKDGEQKLKQKVAKNN